MFYLSYNYHLSLMFPFILFVCLLIDLFVCFVLFVYVAHLTFTLISEKGQEELELKKKTLAFVSQSVNEKQTEISIIL